MVGEVVADRYELEELVGTGGMSSVYRARDRLLERQVAIKVLHEHYSRDDDYVERFRREARAAAKLSHPNIVTVIDRGEADGRQFIVFEYVDGENLKQLVDEQGAAAGTRRARARRSRSARALAFAHAQGLVHRDVKPQNVLLGNGDVKVTDFGIARSIDVPAGLTQTGTVLGTSEYISPEQATGRQVDTRTDIYSLGAVLYELLAGQPPYSGDSFVAVAMRHVNDPVAEHHARPAGRPAAGGRRSAPCDGEGSGRPLPDDGGARRRALRLSRRPRRPRRRPDGDRRPSGAAARASAAPRVVGGRRSSFLVGRGGSRGGRGGRLLRRAPHGLGRRRREQHRRCPRPPGRVERVRPSGRRPGARRGGPERDRRRSRDVLGDGGLPGQRTSAVSRTASGSSSTRAAP